MGSIYRVWNKLDGKSYIGQSIHDARKTRIRQHLAGYSHMSNRYLGHAISKHGKDNFDWEILHDGILPEFLDEFEKDAIKEYKCMAPDGYNLTPGGKGSNTTYPIRKSSSRRVVAEYPRRIFVAVTQEMYDEIHSISKLLDVSSGAVIRACIEAGIPDVQYQVNQLKRKKRSR